MGDTKSPSTQTSHSYGKGKVIWGGDIGVKKDNIIYPDYEVTAKIIKEMGVSQDFESTGSIRYTHRTNAGWDIYFVSNRMGSTVKATCNFRTTKGVPQLWDPLTGKTRRLPEYSVNEEITTLPLQFDAYQSFFIVFSKERSKDLLEKKNFASKKVISTLDGSWSVSFDPKWGGPAKITFDHLVDWTSRPEKGIRYYSGIAVYRKILMRLH